jgi:hypothetical protein
MFYRLFFQTVITNGGFEITDLSGVSSSIGMVFIDNQALT